MQIDAMNEYAERRGWDKIHELLSAGMSKKAIAEQLGIGRASVYCAIEAVQAKP